MKTQAEVVQELIDDIINHIKVMTDEINQLDKEINSDSYTSNTEFIVKKNTIELLKAQSNALSNILKQRIGEIMMIKGIPYTKVDRPGIINNTGNWNGDSK
jgi:hypothetical protein